MKQKERDDAKEKTIPVIVNEVRELRKELATLTVERSVTMPKDTNIVSKKKQKLALLLTIISQKNNSLKKN